MGLLLVLVMFLFFVVGLIAVALLFFSLYQFFVRLSHVEYIRLVKKDILSQIIPLIIFSSEDLPKELKEIRNKCITRLVVVVFSLFIFLVCKYMVDIDRFSSNVGT